MEPRYRKNSGTLIVLFYLSLIFITTLFSADAIAADKSKNTFFLSQISKEQLINPISNMPKDAKNEISAMLEKHFSGIVNAAMGSHAKTTYNAVTTLAKGSKDLKTKVNRLEIVSYANVSNKNGKKSRIGLYIYFHTNDKIPGYFAKNGASLSQHIQRRIAADKKKKAYIKKENKKRKEWNKKNRKKKKPGKNRKMLTFKPTTLPLGPYTALPDGNGWEWLTFDTKMTVLIRTLDSKVDKAYMKSKAQSVHSLLSGSGLYGFISKMLSFKAIGLTDAAAEERANQLMAVIKKWEAERGLKVIYRSLAGSAAVALHIKDEEGTRKPLRTTHEIDFYNKLKKYSETRKPGMVLSMGDLLYIALDTIPRNRDKTVNLFLAVLTIHNVSKIIARPEQWMAEFMGNPRYPGIYGHPESDSVYPVLKDLLGMKSTVGKSMPSIFKKTFDVKWKTDNSRVVDPSWTVNLFGPKGIFNIQSGCEIAPSQTKKNHWNGGCHYYYWVGVLGQMSLGAPGVWWGGRSEQGAKNTTATQHRGVVQISYFRGGATFANKIILSQRHIDMGELLDAAGP